MTDREKKIRDAAYRLWQEAGAPEGQDDRHWLEAEKTIRDAEASAQPARPTKATQPLDPLEKKPVSPTSDRKNAQAAVSAVAKALPKSDEKPESIAEEPPVSAAGPAAATAAKREEAELAGGETQPLTPGSIAKSKGASKSASKPSKPTPKR